METDTSARRPPPVDFSNHQVVECAYDACEEIVRVHAQNFAYGIRGLPADKRRALSAVYAFARRVDDIADGELRLDQKLALLARASDALPWRQRPRADDPVLVALDDACRRFELPRDPFEDLIEGVERDAQEVVRYETLADLVGYCRLVAGSIGRLVVTVLGADDPPAAAGLADDMGVALQLTNILRDVLEDRERGRVYLPRDALARYGCSPDLVPGPLDGMTDLIRELVTRNREWYARARPLLSLLDADGAACVTAMVAVYEAILDRIDAAPREVMRRRVGLTALEKQRLAASAFQPIRPSPRAA